MTFSSSRTLPGQAYSVSTCIASGANVTARVPRFCENLLEEMVDESRDVGAPIAQRRNRAGE